MVKVPRGFARLQAQDPEGFRLRCRLWGQRSQALKRGYRWTRAQALAQAAKGGRARWAKS